MREKSKFKEFVFKKNLFPEKCSCEYIECGYVDAAGKFLPGFRENMDQSLKIFKEKNKLFSKLENYASQFFKWTGTKVFCQTAEKFLVNSTHVFHSKSEKNRTQKIIKNSFTQVVPLVT